MAAFLLRKKPSSFPSGETKRKNCDWCAATPSCPIRICGTTVNLISPLHPWFKALGGDSIDKIRAAVHARVCAPAQAQTEL